MELLYIMCKKCSCLLYRNKLYETSSSNILTFFSININLNAFILSLKVLCVLSSEKASYFSYLNLFFNALDFYFIFNKWILHLISFNKVLLIFKTNLFLLKFLLLLKYCINLACIKNLLASKCNLKYDLSKSSLKSYFDYIKKIFIILFIKFQNDRFFCNILKCFCVLHLYKFFH